MLIGLGRERGAQTINQMKVTYIQFRITGPSLGSSAMKASCQHRVYSKEFVSSALRKPVRPWHVSDLRTRHGNLHGDLARQSEQDRVSTPMRTAPRMLAIALITTVKLWGFVFVDCSHIGPADVNMQCQLYHAATGLRWGEAEAT